MAFLVMAKRAGQSYAGTNFGRTFEGTAMNVRFRIAQELYVSMQKDLSRPHKIAYERVGFIRCAAGIGEGNELILLAESYEPVADEHYEKNKEVGAMIGSGAFRRELQHAYKSPCSIFHIHRHEHYGVPKLSETDITESYRFVPDFFKVQPNRPHGVIVLSHDSAYGLCWLPNERSPVPIREFGLIGRPIRSVRA